MVLISPVLNDSSFTDNLGNPLSGGLIFAYEAGSSSVLKDTFTSAAGDVANANPIVLDSSGRLDTAIWLTAGEAYHLVLTQADGTTVLIGFDDITGVGSTGGGGGGGGGVGGNIWVPLLDAAYLTTTSFSTTGNETENLAVGNRVRLTQSAGYVYGTISAVAFSDPSTVCSVILDGGATLNSSLFLVEYSQNIRNGRTVEAGSVTYNTTLTPPANTVGSALTTLTAQDVVINSRIDALRKVWTASGTTTYAITPVPAISSLGADAVFTVFFTNASAGAATLNVNGLGAVPLKSYKADGTVEDAVITAGRVSDVAYTGSVFILLDTLPAGAVAAAPHGMQVFSSNGTFTVPAGVYSIDVTCAGAGGGGGAAYTVSGGDSGDSYFGGGGGGGGAKVQSVISTSPGTTYSVGVGAAGVAGPSETSPGSAGGSSSFGITLVIATGGTGGGSSYPTAPGGSGGNVGSSGTFISPGANGQVGIMARAGTGGAGAEAFYGSGGDGGFGVVSPANGGQGFVKVQW